MLVIDEAEGRVVLHHPDGTSATFPFDTPDAFEAISAAWLRCGWGVKYVYGFTWMGRPIIQLPEDMFRIQEVICRVQPDVIVETGVAHGGSLVFYASLLSALGHGRVIGVDIEIRPPNRAAIEAHRLASRITLIEGSSVESETIAAVAGAIRPDEKVLVVLDSNHTRSHVEKELDAYALMVTPDSYVVACDGIMADLAGAPRSSADWKWNNPISAIETFLARNPNFALEEPTFSFNEGQVRKRITYWPKSYLRRRA